MTKETRPLSPHLSVYRWQVTNTLSIIHRMSIFSAEQFLNYANQSDLVISSYFKRGEDRYVIFNYSEKAKLLPPERYGINSF